VAAHQFQKFGGVITAAAFFYGGFSTAVKILADPDIGIRRQLGMASVGGVPHYRVGGVA